MLRRKLKYHKFLFIFLSFIFVGFCVLFFQRRIVLADSGIDITVTEIKPLSDRGISYTIRNIGGTETEKASLDRTICKVENDGRQKCTTSSNSLRYSNLLEAQGTFSSSFGLSKTLLGFEDCFPEEEEFKVKVCVKLTYTDIQESDTSNNCLTETLNYKDFKVECRNHSECGTSACLSCHCIGGDCTTSEGRDIYKRGSYMEYGTFRGGRRTVYEKCTQGKVKETYCFLAPLIKYGYDETNIVPVKSCTAGKASYQGLYCGLKKEFVNCPSGYECSDGVCRWVTSGSPPVRPRISNPHIPEWQFTWMFDKSHKEHRYYLETSPDNVYSGTDSIKIVSTDESEEIRTILSQDIDRQIMGKRVRLSSWIKTEGDITAYLSYRVEPVHRDIEDFYSYKPATDRFVKAPPIAEGSSDDWVQLIAKKDNSDQWIIPENQGPSYRKYNGYIILQTKGSGTVWFDDIVLEEVVSVFPQGDANCDDKVNSLDFGFWRRSYQIDERADFNGNGISDLPDCFTCFDHYSHSF